MTAILNEALQTITQNVFGLSNDCSFNYMVAKFNIALHLSQLILFISVAATFFINYL